MMESHPYQHRPPRRPVHLARRLTPPPIRPAPPNLRILLYVGVALAAAMALLALPYLVSYLIGWMSGLG